MKYKHLYFIIQLETMRTTHLASNIIYLNVKRDG